MGVCLKGLNPAAECINSFTAAQIVFIPPAGLQAGLIPVAFDPASHFFKRFKIKGMLFPGFVFKGDDSGDAAA